MSFPDVNQFFKNNPLVVFLILVWSLFWKGKALWKAAKSGQLYWFIALLVINSVGILELIYLYVFSKKSSAIKSD